MKLFPLLILAIDLCFFTGAKGQEAGPLPLTQTVQLPGVTGGFNHLSADGEHHRVFAPATTSNTLEVVDLNTGKPLRSLPGERPAAALFAPEFNQLYVTRGRSVCIYDGSTFDLLRSVQLQSGADEMGCDPKTKQLYVGCMEPDKTSITVVSIPDGKSIGEIKLPAKPQGFAVEQNGNRIFVNLPSLKEIAVLDREKQTLLAPWFLKDAAWNYPMTLDEADHRLFVGCRSPAQLVVIDTTTGKQVAGVAIGDDTDDLSYDMKLKRVYVACGGGQVDVIEQHDADHYSLIKKIPVPPGSRNCGFSLKANEFYLAVPQRGGETAEIRVFRPQK